MGGGEITLAESGKDDWKFGILLKTHQSYEFYFFLVLPKYFGHCYWTSWMKMLTSRQLAPPTLHETYGNYEHICKIPDARKCRWNIWRETSIQEIHWEPGRASSYPDLRFISHVLSGLHCFLVIWKSHLLTINQHSGSPICIGSHTHTHTIRKNATSTHTGYMAEELVIKIS